MDTINNDVMQQAAEHVIHANELGDIHTVILELNGQHGGVDLIIRGYPTGSTREFARRFELR